jgi:hypothetical protein
MGHTRRRHITDSQCNWYYSHQKGQGVIAVTSGRGTKGMLDERQSRDHKKKIFRHIQRLEWHLTTYAMQQPVYNDEEYNVIS